MAEQTTSGDRFNRNNSFGSAKIPYPYNKISSFKSIDDIIKKIGELGDDSNKTSTPQQKESKERCIDYSSINNAIELYNRYQKSDHEYRQMLQDNYMYYRYPDTEKWKWDPKLVDLFAQTTKTDADAYYNARDKLNQSDLKYLIEDLEKKKATIEKNYSPKLEEAEQSVEKCHTPSSNELSARKNVNKFSFLKNTFFTLLFISLFSAMTFFIFDFKPWVHLLVGCIVIISLVLGIILSIKLKNEDKRYQRILNKRGAELQKAEKALYLLRKSNEDELNGINERLNMYNLLLKRSRTY